MGQRGFSSTGLGNSRLTEQPMDSVRVATGITGNVDFGGHSVASHVMHKGFRLLV